MTQLMVEKPIDAEAPTAEIPADAPLPPMFPPTFTALPVWVTGALFSTVCVIGPLKLACTTLSATIVLTLTPADAPTAEIDAEAPVPEMPPAEMLPPEMDTAPVVSLVMYWLMLPSSEDAAAPANVVAMDEMLTLPVAPRAEILADAAGPEMSPVETDTPVTLTAPLLISGVFASPCPMELVLRPSWFAPPPVSEPMLDTDTEADRPVAPAEALAAAPERLPTVTPLLDSDTAPSLLPLWAMPPPTINRAP